jgi:peptidoglycan-associated lipoprotein
VCRNDHARSRSERRCRLQREARARQATDKTYEKSVLATGSSWRGSFEQSPDCFSFLLCREWADESSPVFRQRHVASATGRRWPRATSGDLVSGGRIQWRRAREGRRDALCIIAIAALALGPILAGCRPALAQTRPPAHAGTASPTQPFVSTQVQPAPAVPVGPTPSSDRPIGLPRVRDYAPIPELRDIYFDSGKEAIRPRDVEILAANAAWLRAHPDHLLLIEGHSDNRGPTNGKNESNMDLGERRAQAAMTHLVTLGVDPRRITILSYGEERPQCTEESERCWSLNRRLRFLAKPP